MFEFGKREQVQKRSIAFVIVPIFLAACYLSLVRLDNTLFWDDEAETGIIAKNFARFGRLTGWDGRNLLTYRNGGILDENLRTRMPPLDYIMPAASFRVFGVSTWAGRFPFVLAGLGSLVLLTVILRENFSSSKDSSLWIYGTAVQAFSVPFLLYIRQCRYYALAMLFSLLIFLFYRRCLQTGRFIYFVLLAAAAVLLFYTNFLLCTAFLSALVLVCVIFHKDNLRRNLFRFFVAVSLFALATVPYAIYYRIWHRPDMPSEEIWYVRKLILMWWNLRALNLPGLLPWIAAAGLIYFIVRYHKKDKDIAAILQWLVLSIGYVFFLSLLSPQPIEGTKAADIRYLIPAMPFLSGLVGIFIWFVHRRTIPGAIAILILVITTNLLSVTPGNWKFQWLLPAYINEVHHNYPTAYGEAVRFLQENAKQDETVFVWPEFANYPIMFYMGDKIRMCCTLDSQSSIPLNKIRNFNAPLLIEENFPDWIILFALLPETNQYLSYFSRQHLQEGQQVKFIYKLVKVLDVYWLDTARPELQWHSFRPKTDFNRQSEAVYIFERFSDKAEL